MKKLIALLLIMLLLISAFSGCTVQEADKVNNNRKFMRMIEVYVDYCLYLCARKLHLL